MRAISAFSLEAGTSTFGWRACIAFRTRVSMSAMGSLVIKLLQLVTSSPSSRRGFPRSARAGGNTDGKRRTYAGRRAGARTASSGCGDAWAAWECQASFVPWLPAKPAGSCPASNLSRSLRSWPSVLLLPERHPHLLQQRDALGIRARCRRNRNIHALGLVHLGVIDLREDQLVLHTQSVITAPVERLGRYPAEIAHAR